MDTANGPETCSRSEARAEAGPSRKAGGFVIGVAGRALCRGQSGQFRGHAPAPVAAVQAAVGAKRRRSLQPHPEASRGARVHPHGHRAPGLGTGRHRADPVTPGRAAGPAASPLCGAPPDRPDPYFLHYRLHCPLLDRRAHPGRRRPCHHKARELRGAFAGAFAGSAQRADVIGEGDSGSEWARGDASFAAGPCE